MINNTVSIINPITIKEITTQSIVSMDWKSFYLFESKFIFNFKEKLKKKTNISSMHFHRTIDVPQKTVKLDKTV